METRRNSTTVVGFTLLPSDLIHYIILRLALPDIFHLKSVNKFITSIISDQDFARRYNLRSSSSTWLFVYKKRWHRDPVVVHGYTTRSPERWFKVMVGDILRPVIPPGEDLYFLTACGNFFLFALNCSREVISVNPVTRNVERIPQSPLGPRGTSSWRRSGIKLLVGPYGSGDFFRFLFAEMVDGDPTLFEYDSRTNKWKSTIARENNVDDRKDESGGIFLSASNGPRRSIVICVGKDTNEPVVLRPVFSGDLEDGELAVGFSWGSVINRLHIYGDGRMLIVRSGSESLEDANRGIRVVKGVELWGLSPNGRQWAFLSKVPNGLIHDIKKPYWVMMGCLEERQGTIRAILMSNFDGVWDIIWLSFDIEKEEWAWVPLPEFKMEGSNMAGVTFSSGLTIS